MTSAILHLGSPLHQLLPVHPEPGVIEGFTDLRKAGQVLDLARYRFVEKGRAVTFEEALTIAVVVLEAEAFGRRLVSRMVVEEVDMAAGSHLVGPIAWKPLLRPEGPHGAAALPRTRLGRLLTSLHRGLRRRRASRAGPRQATVVAPARKTWT